MDPLPDVLLDHFHRPRNARAMADATARGRAENAACGDLVEVYVRTEEGRVRAASFLCQGCSATIACASWLTERVPGLDVREAAALEADALFIETGDPGPARRHGMLLVLRALRAALECRG